MNAPEIGIGTGKFPGFVPPSLPHPIPPVAVPPLGIVGELLGGSPLTGLSAALGNIVGTTEWGTFSISQTAVDGENTDDGLPYYVPTNIYYWPNSTKVDASEIAFVQIIAIYDTKGNSTGLNKAEKARMTTGGWAVDRYLTMPSGWYNYDKQGNPYAGWGNVGNTNTIASLIDQPSQDLPSVNWYFESYAIAKAGKQAGQVYGGVGWGFSVDQNQHVTLRPPKILAGQSLSFMSAVAKWNIQAAPGFTGVKNAPGQLRLPAFHD
jgi:hypothetical protein